MRSIVIHSKIKEQAPKEIKLLTNKSALGFEDVEEAGEAETAQMLAFSEEDVTLGNPISLRFVRFQNVNSLHVGISISRLLFGRLTLQSDFRALEPRSGTYDSY